MRFLPCLALCFALLAPAVARAADWTVNIGDITACEAVQPGGSCVVATAGANTSAVSIVECAKWTFVAFGTGATLTLQACADSSCALVEPILNVPLTGDAPNTFTWSEMPLDWVRIATSDSVTVVVHCRGDS